MTREEQIAAELKKHDYDDICCHLMFLRGIRWADEHPVDVWHDASEEPEDNSQILYQDKFGVCWSISRLEKYVCDWDWARFACAHLMERWAYISDLLPKGGE